MRIIRYSSRAIKNLRAIADYSTQNWGVAKKNIYLKEIKHCIMQLAKNPKMGRLRRDIAPELYAFPKGSHVIIYRITQDHIFIADILHESMDLSNKF